MESSQRYALFFLSVINVSGVANSLGIERVGPVGIGAEEEWGCNMPKKKVVKQNEEEEIMFDQYGITGFIERHSFDDFVRACRDGNVPAGDKIYVTDASASMPKSGSRFPEAF